MTDLVMKIKRSEYLEMKRVQTILAQENEALKKEIETLKREKSTETVEYKKKGANKYLLVASIEESISLPALKTFKGTSIISVDTSVQPSNIKAKYVRL